MAAACVLSDLVSFFSCAQQAMPFSEFTVFSVFVVFFMLLKVYPLREALPASFFVSTIVALIFMGLNLINWAVPVAGIVLTALSVTFLYLQNDTG